MDASDGDAAPIDASVDAGPPCSRSSDCDDGIVCTADICVSGRCRRTLDHDSCEDAIFCNGEGRCDEERGCIVRPVGCDDDVRCTVDGCDEAARACVNEPDADLCPISHRCDPSTGCQARALAHSAGDIYEVDLPSGATRFLVRSPVGLTDIALSPDRTLYGVDFAGLYSVDIDTGEATILLPEVPNANAMDADPDGEIYAGAGNSVYSFDIEGGTSSIVASFPPGFSSSGDLAFLEGRLVATVTPHEGGDDSLVEVDLEAGTSSEIGSLGFRCVWGLAAFGPTLYGLTCEGELLLVDADTADARSVAESDVGFWGATAR